MANIVKELLPTVTISSKGPDQIVKPIPTFQSGWQGMGSGGGSVPAYHTVSRSIRVQPWMTFETSGGCSEDIVQPARAWLSGEQAATYHCKVEISYLSSGWTLELESSPTPEGPWVEVVAFTAQTDTVVVLSSEGGSNKFSGYIRWRLPATTSDWGACFQIKATPGINVSGITMTPKIV